MMKGNCQKVVVDSRCHLPNILQHHLLSLCQGNGLIDHDSEHRANEIIKTDLSPTSFFFHGVCMMIDVIDFNRLSGTFCAKGKLGLDDLQQATNGYMGRLVECIYKYGGDIIKFAGDTIICIFVDRSVRDSIMKGHKEAAIVESGGDKDKENLNSSSSPAGVVSSKLCHMVLQCAMELRDIRTEQLTVHVAASCGEMCFGVLGGYKDRWECLISGTCLMQLSQCLDDAPSREVAVTSDIAAVLGSEVISSGYGAEKLHSGNYKLTQMQRKEQDVVNIFQSSDALQIDSAELLQLAKKFVPVPITLAFESGGLRYLAEIREVTTMSMKWDSYNAEEHRDLVTLQSALYEVQKVVDEVSGFVRQFLVDDKGCVLIACWGVPTASFLNNANRALYAAAKIRDKFRELRMECSIGITTGNVYCGNVGSELRREYAAIGDVVNLSARLMSKAHGGIYIDEASYLRLPMMLWGAFDVADKEIEVNKEYALQTGEAIQIELQDIFPIDFEISLRHRNALNMLLDSLPKSLEKPFSAFQQQIKPDLDSTYRFYTISLDGGEKSNKSVVVDWFCKEIKGRSIRINRIAIAKRDQFLEYKVICKVLMEFMGLDATSSMATQQSLITQLLHKIYGDNYDFIEKKGIPAMKAVFGLHFVADVAEKNDDKELSKSAKTKTNFKVGLATSSTSNEISLTNMSGVKASAQAVIEVLRGVLTFLLKASPAVIVLEDLHYCDEGSLSCLQMIPELPVDGLLLYSIMPPHSLESAHSPKKHQRLTSTRMIEALSAFCLAFSRKSCNTYISLDDVNPTQIEGILRAILVNVKLPLELLYLVQKWSNGILPLVTVIARILKSIDIGKAMSFMKEAAEGKEDKQDEQISASNHIEDPYLLFKSLVQFKLNILSAEDQQILQYAAILGSDFSRYILYGVLATDLKSSLQGALRTLIKELWLQKISSKSEPQKILIPASSLLSHISDSKSESNAKSSDYRFSHDAVRQAIVNLLPSQLCVNLHRAVVAYYEVMSQDDYSVFEEMSRHLAYIDESRAFEFAMRAVCFYLQPNIQDMDKVVHLLSESIKYCKYVMDAKVVITLLGAVRDIITNSQIASDVKEVFVDPAINREISFKNGRPADTTGSIFISRIIWPGLCCGLCDQTIQVNRRVAPDPTEEHSIGASPSQRSSASNRQDGNASRASNKSNFQSMVSEYSMMSPTYTIAGVECILEYISGLEVEVSRLNTQLEEEGKIGVLQLWQREIVFQDEIVIPEQSFKSQTAFIMYTRASWQTS